MPKLPRASLCTPGNGFLSFLPGNIGAKGIESLGISCDGSFGAGFGGMGTGDGVGAGEGVGVGVGVGEGVGDGSGAGVGAGAGPGSGAGGGATFGQRVSFDQPVQYGGIDDLSQSVPFNTQLAAASSGLMLGGAGSAGTGSLGATGPVGSGMSPGNGTGVGIGSSDGLPGGATGLLQTDENGFN